jgi:hypothetical protein
VELDKDGAVVSPSTNHKRTRATKHAQQLPQRGPPPQTLLPPITNGKAVQHPATHPHLHPPGKDEYSEDEQEEDEYEYGDGDEEDEDDQEEEEEEEEEEDDQEEEEDDEDIPHPQPTRRVERIAPNGQPIPPSRRGAVQAPAGGRRNVAGKGRDGLFNIGSSLTVTGASNSSVFCI